MSSNPHSSLGSDQHVVSQSDEKNDAEDDDISKLPAHLQSIRDGLLDFSHFIGLRAAMLIAGGDEDVIPLSAYKPDGVGKLELARESEFVESAQGLAKYAQSVAQDGYGWHKLFRAIMTGRMDSAHYGFNMHKSISWVDNEIYHATATLGPPKPPTTIPMPGLYFGFSIQQTDQNSKTGFRNDSSFDNYTRKQLDQLTTQGLHCVLHVPSSVDEAISQTTTSVPQHQSVCFPWGIFKAYGVFEAPEVNDVSFASAVSQVSAAASTALSMFERLAKFTDEKHDGQHIPPVIAITSVGANVTVWLAYCDIVDDKILDHKMISIWEGKITKIWDAIQFCRIIDNLSFWAQHCLKPKVTQYLSQWRLRHCPDIPNIYSLLEIDTRTAKIVHRIQDRLSALGLSPNEDLPALVRQAVVFQEVMDSRSQEEKKIPAAAMSLPSRPRDSSLKAALSSSTGSQQGIDPKARPKGKEIRHQNSAFLSGESEKGTAETSKPHNTHIIQLKPPPKNQTSALVFPDKGRESAGENSIVLEDTKATPTNDMTKKHVLNSKSPTISKANGRGNDEGSFSNPLQMKISNAEKRKSLLIGPQKEPDDTHLNFVQRTLHSMASRVEKGHVLSLEKQKRRNRELLLKEEKSRNIKNSPNSYKKSSTGQLSSSPNFFVSEAFELSFEVTPLLDLDMTGPSLQTIHRYGPYPTLHIGAVEHNEYPRRTGLYVDLPRVNLARQRTIIEPLLSLPTPPLRVRIPWKGKYIIVKLPPVNPASLPIKRKSDF